MKKVFLVFLLLAVSCAETNRKATIGAIVGGLVGGGVGAIVGHQSDHEGAGVAIGASAGAGLGALIGAVMDGNTGPKYTDNTISSQDRAFYPTQNDNFQNDYALNNYSSNSYNTNSYKSETTSYSYDLSSNGANQVNAGYFGAINGGTYSDYDSNLMNYVNTGQARGYLGALNNDPRVKMANKDVINNNMPPQGLYGTSPYTGGSYAGKSYLGASGNQNFNSQTYANQNFDNQNFQNDSVVNARNVDYSNDSLRASYSFNNPSVVENNISVDNNKLAYDDNDNDCAQAKVEVESAKSTEVIADKLFYYRKALRLCPDSAEYHNGLGEVFLILNRKEDAIYEFKEALKINPSLDIAKKNINMVNNRY